MSTFMKSKNTMYTVPYLVFLVIYTLVTFIMNSVKVAMFGPHLTWVYLVIAFAFIISLTLNGLIFIVVFSFRQELEDKERRISIQ